MPTPEEEAQYERERAEREAEFKRLQDLQPRGRPFFDPPRTAPSSFDLHERREFGSSQAGGDRGRPPVVIGGQICSVTRVGESVRLQIGRTCVHATVDEIALFVNAIELAVG